MISWRGFWESGRRNCWRNSDALEGLSSDEDKVGMLKLAGSIRLWAFWTKDDHGIMVGRCIGASLVGVFLELITDDVGTGARAGEPDCGGSGLGI